jgi:tripartite-type tricarboxylate transporter receptor subunit TctC
VRKKDHFSLKIDKRIYLLITVIFLSLMIVFIVYNKKSTRSTIRWIIPFKVGGGSDVWARIYAPYFQNQLGENSVVVVKNMPGGGSINGGNYFHTRTVADGWTMFGSSGSTTFPYLLGNRKVQYDFAKYHMVFASPSGGVVYIKPGLGVRSTKDLNGLKKKLSYGSQGPTSLDIIPLLAFDMLGLEVKAIFGYKGRGAGRVAFEQGETNIDYQTSTAYIKNVRPLVEQHLAVPLMTWGVLDKDGNIVRDPLEPDLPCFPEVYEIVHAKKPSGQVWEAWKAFFIAGFGLQKAMWLPENSPPEIIKKYREVAAKIIADPEFQNVVGISLGGYRQLAGEQAQEAFKQVINIPEENKTWMHNWIKKKYDISVK